MLVRWLRRSLPKLGLLFLVALALAMASLVAFAELADEVMEAEFHGFDHAVLVWVGQHVNPTWTPYVLGLSWLGTPLGISLLGTAFGSWLLLRRKPWDALLLLVVLLGGGALTVGLKALFRQPRPEVFPPLSVETSYGFPSGHALMGVCLFGFVACWIVAQAPRSPWRWLVGIAVAGLAVLVSLSRLYLGVHWPTDVAAGGLAAVFWLSSCLALRRLLALDGGRRRR